MSSNLDRSPGWLGRLRWSRPEPRLREGLDNILHAHTGGLIVIGDADDLAFLFSGGIKLDLDYTPALLYELAKMDGAIVLSSNATKIAHANVQLTPDPTIHTLETGTRHRTAERVSKQTDAIVVAISERREVVSLYVDGVKYILADIPVVLAKANQALATLDKYRSRLDQVSTRLTALEFEGGATLHDVLTVLQRAELVTRMAVEIERYIVELGTEGRLIEMQLDETMVGVSARQGGARPRLPARGHRRGVLRGLRPAGAPAPPGPARLRPLAELLGYDRKLNTPRLPDLAARHPDSRPHPAAAEDWSSSGSSTSSEDSRNCSPPLMASWKPSTESARSGRRTSVRAFADCRRSTWSTATCRRGNPASAGTAHRRPNKRRTPSQT